MNIGMKIKALREAKHLSQAALARKAGVQQSSISYIESGEKNPSFDTVVKLARVLHVDLNMLAEIDTSPKLLYADAVLKVANVLNVDINTLVKPPTE